MGLGWSVLLVAGSAGFWSVVDVLTSLILACCRCGLVVRGMSGRKLGRRKVLG